MPSPADNNEPAAATAHSPAREAWAMFIRNKSAIAGLVLMTLVLALTLIVPAFYPVDPFDIVWGPLAPPGDAPEIPLGSDFVGRDVLAGIIHGGRATLAVGASAALITVVIGISIGAAAGFYGGFVDEMLMRLTEFFQVLPALLFAMVLVSLFSQSLTTIAIAIGVVSWPPVARLTRAEFLKIKELEYVKAARAIGARNRRLIWRVILPNALPPPYRVRDAHHRRRDPVRSRALVPRARRSERHELGADDRIQPRLRGGRVVGGDLSGSRDLRHRAEREPHRRRPDRRPQPEAARPMSAPIPGMHGVIVPGAVPSLAGGGSAGALDSGSRDR